MYSSWPIHSNQKCAWDGEIFTWAPVLLIISTNGCKIVCIENYFCSFNCAKAYMLFSGIHYNPTMVNMLLYLRMRFSKLQLITNDIHEDYVHLYPAPFLRSYSLQKIKLIREKEFLCIKSTMSVVHAQKLGLLLRFYKTLSLSMSVKERIKDDTNTQTIKKINNTDSNKKQLEILRTARVVSDAMQVEKYSNNLLASLDISVRRIHNSTYSLGK
jgi:hypothetical protein